MLINFGKKVHYRHVSFALKWFKTHNKEPLADTFFKWGAEFGNLDIPKPKWNFFRKKIHYRHISLGLKWFKIHNKVPLANSFFGKCCLKAQSYRVGHYFKLELASGKHYSISWHLLNFIPVWVSFHQSSFKEIWVKNAINRNKQV